MRKTQSALSVLVLFIAVVCGEAKVPELRIDDKDGNKPLKLLDLEIHVILRQHLARTQFVLTYKNEKNQDLTGEFLFPVPEQATVSDVGLYFNNQLRRASIVERTEGRTAFEQVVHKRVDPALAEWMSGDTFRLSVYPIPAKKEKKVYIAYDEETISGTGATRYFLDLKYNTKIRNFLLEIDADSTYALHGGGLPFRQQNGKWTCDLHDVVLNTEVSMSGKLLDPPIALVEPAEQGLYYVSLPLSIKASLKPYPKASRIVLFWDVSGSTAHADRQKVIDFLRQFFGKQEKQVDVSVIPFHLKPENAVTLTNVGATEGFALLEQRLKMQFSLGATNLVKLFNQLETFLHDEPLDTRIILISDGLDTINTRASVSQTINGVENLKRRFLVVSPDDDSDSQTLKQIADVTDGWYVNLSSGDNQEQVEYAMQLPVQISLHAAPSNFQELNLQQFSNGNLLISCRARNILGTSRITIRIGDEYVDLDVSFRTLQENQGLVRSAWARSALREMFTSHADDQTILEFGKNFHLLTPRTSLLVLESWQDYQRYGIEMPSDVKEEYAKYMKDLEKQSRKQIQKMTTITSGSSGITGTIVDENGAAPLPGVLVTVSNSSNGTSSTTTDVNGVFAIKGIRNGTYEIRAELAAFTTVGQEIRVEPNQTPDLMIKMKPGTEEVLVVTGESPMVDATSTGIGGSFAADSPPPPAQAAPPAERVAVPEHTNVDSNSNEIANRPALILEDENSRRKLLARTVQDLGNRPVEDAIRLYLSTREHLQRAKEYYLNAAQVVHALDSNLGVRVLTDMLEFLRDDPGTIRTVALTLEAWKENDLAESLLMRAGELAPHEPQSWRSLGLLYARTGRNQKARECFQKLRDGQWDARFEGLAAITNQEIAQIPSEDGIPVDPDIDPLFDLRIVLDWDTNYTDVDLHVKEPSGEEVFYSNPKGKSGSTLSHDITQGYGPEVYELKNAPAGKYKIFVQYYASDQTTMDTATVAHVAIIYGGRASKREDFSFVIGNEKENYDIKTIMLP